MTCHLIYRHVQHVPSAQQSHINDLLEIDALVMNPRPPLVDPWGSIISAPTTVAPSIPKTQVTQFRLLYKKKKFPHIGCLNDSVFFFKSLKLPIFYYLMIPL